MVHFGELDVTRSMGVDDDESHDMQGPAVGTLEPSRQRLPKVVYSALKPKQLKQLLEKHHLPTHGDRKTLHKRHESLVHLYNAECDTKNARSLVECAREVCRREKEAQERRMAERTRAPSFDKDCVQAQRADYIRQRAAAFKILIKQARATRKKKSQTKKT
eukprot:m.229284 g.229284  ORF g.229284 m.229284 type:complete len:161 (-) comp38951_c0_seq1:28-510(-)